ncbi:asparagine synthase-domain-containing protein [Syncephalastrum racemosum]|uniref:Asparagine synthase-domain-containing protein n=1 Tax=Syncephalastrum racemosum TaxID=13706 RepID=A0A1X2HWF4_SYNRA|nr:asparagine synthase-domain-containing protein [Syncephalastrum racemosum]
MCGILFHCSATPCTPEAWDSLAEINTHRGPDAQQTQRLQVANQHLQFFSSVLHLRGPDTVAQPLCSQGNVLCFNGEIFSGLPMTLQQNDTEVLLHEIQLHGVLETFAKAEGPYAFVYYEAQTQSLWYGRDCLGRRSLLIDDSDGLWLSSVADPQRAWRELPADGIYQLCLADPNNLTTTHKHTWGDALPAPFPRLNATLPDTIDDEQHEQALTGLMQVLEEAVRLRVQDIPHHTKAETDDVRVAILFSGGVDCITLAALAHRHLPPDEPVDLLNVAFDNPRTGTTSFDTPDRRTGRASLRELQEQCPRPWRFVEINVPFSEAQEHRQTIIDRMYPLDTVMDLSIAMALWFAARGQGSLNDTPYISRARVLISGLGADEQLGGYSRHREAFRHGGWTRLVEETQLDVDRISTRNLGRDDRIISDHGKEARFPFLSTHVITYLCGLPIGLKMDMTLERGVGEKRLLRRLAHRLGLVEASQQWKRAIQFGAKTAKMTGATRAEKGQHKLSSA